MLIIGAVIAYFITIIPPQSMQVSNGFIFLAGALAICAMILPGISGSFILLLIGAYKPVLDAIHYKDFKTLFFLIFDADGGLSEIFENSYASNATHVGPDVANMLINLHVTKVIAGRFGPKFKEALEKKQIECIEQTGFAAQVAKEFFD